jgi:hypothetical protein
MPANTRGTVVPGPGRISPFRLLVRAVDDRRLKGFVWEIFPLDHNQPSIDRSSTAFKSLAEAYDEGAVTLRRLNSR